MRRCLGAAAVLLSLSGAGPVSGQVSGPAGDGPPAEEAAPDAARSRESLQQALNAERLRAGELQLTVTRLRKQLAERAERAELARARQEEQLQRSAPPQAAAGMKTGRVLLIALLALLLGVLLGLGLRIGPPAGGAQEDEG